MPSSNSKSTETGRTAGTRRTAGTARHRFSRPVRLARVVRLVGLARPVRLVRVVAAVTCVGMIGTSCTNSGAKPEPTTTTTTTGAPTSDPTSDPSTTPDKITTTTATTTADWMARDYQEASKAIGTGDYPRAVSLLQATLSSPGQPLVAVTSQPLTLPLGLTVSRTRVSPSWPRLISRVG